MTRRGLALWSILPLMAVAVPARAQTVLTLEAAIENARTHAPELAQAETSVQAAKARADVAKAPLLPQVTGVLGYERSTYNSAAANSDADTTHSRWDTRNSFSASLRASQLIFDFGQTRSEWRAAQAMARASEENEKVAWLAIEHQVRTAFLDAAAARALLQVAQDTLANQERHLAQIQGFVEVGTRPAIDLAQSRTEVANARLQLVRAQNNYAVAKSQLERAMGVDPGDYDVSAELPGPEAEESGGLDALVDVAERNRPEFAALQYRVRAQELSVSAANAGHAPSLSLQASVDEGGSELDQLAFNVGAGVSLTWPIVQGGAVDARVREARATLAGLRIEREILRKDARVELEQALLSLRAAQSAVEIAEEVEVNARELLTLAEGRYSAGVGNVIELGDAQLVLSNAQAQRVGANYELGQARMMLRRGLGK